MASDDPNRQDAARPDAPTSPAAIEAAVARLAPEGTEDEPLPAPGEAPAAPGPQAPAAARAAAVPPSRRGPSPWLALPIGAVAGALAAGAVAYGLVETGSLKPAPTTDLQPLLQRLTALETRQPPDISQPLAQLGTRFTQLDARVAQLDQKLAKAETASGQPASGQPDGDLQRALAATQADVADLKQSLQTLTATLDARFAQVDGQLAKAEAASSSAPAAPPAADPAVTDLQHALAATQAEVASLKQSLQALAAAASQSAGLAPQVAAVSGQIAAVNKRVDEVATTTTSQDRAAAVLVVLGALKDAILSGRPFAAELDAARAVLGPSAGSLDPFAHNASQGYAPPAKLAQRLADAARTPSAPAAADAPAGDSIMGRIVSSAEALVQLKPAGSAAVPSTTAASDETAAIDAAVTAVRAGDLDLALKRIEALPPETKAKLKDITAEIAARRDAANTASALYQQALAAISGKVP